MLEQLHALIVRPLVDRWLATSSISWLRLPTPPSTDVVRAAGDDPDRLLLIGSGIAVGYSVTTHELGLAGQIARQLASSTGRGAVVEVITEQNMTADAAIAALDTRRLRELDAIVLTPGGVEALLMFPAAAWRREIDRGLDHVAQHAPASLRVFIVGVPSLPKIVPLPPLMRVLALLSAPALNRQLRATCAERRRVEFIPFAPTELVGTEGTGRTYARWAEHIVPALSRALQGHTAADTGPGQTGSTARA